LLWADRSLEPLAPERVQNLRRTRGWQTDEVVLLYSGNMGLGHRFTDFLQLAQRPSSADLPTVRWVFSGGGKRRTQIETFKRHNPPAPVELMPYVSWDDLCGHLNAADVHLVSLEPSWAGCMIPSKIQSSFAVGKPVIYVGRPTGTAAEWVLDSGGGWVVIPGNIDALSAAVRDACDPVERTRRGTDALAYARTHFRSDDNCAGLCDLLEAACHPRSSA